MLSYFIRIVTAAGPFYGWGNWGMGWWSMLLEGCHLSVVDPWLKPRVPGLRAHVWTIRLLSPPRITAPSQPPEILCVRDCAELLNAGVWRFEEVTSKVRSEGWGRISGRKEVGMEGGSMEHAKQGKKWHEAFLQSTVRVRLWQEQPLHRWAKASEGRA